MKKRVILSLVVPLFVLCSCVQRSQSPEEQPTVTMVISETATMLPQYIPGSIKLDPGEDYCDEDGAYYKRHYRSIYYSVPSSLMKLVGQEAYDFVGAYFDSYQYDEEPVQMALMLLVKEFDIPKEKFVEVFDMEREISLRLGCDIYSEQYELPNADIIYTFDNEVIDAYYRRENPLEPDWLTNLQTVE